MIKYSQRAIRALAFLFRPYNDLDVYVEDTTIRNLYEVLFGRMLEGKVKINRVFPLGGREAVIDACRNDQNDPSRSRLYIIDGDFEVLLHIAAPSLEYLYRLNVYASENLVFTEAAVIAVAVECLPNDSTEQIRSKAAFKEFLTENIQKLTPLFIVYAMLRRLQAEGAGHIHIQTSGYNIMHLCEDKGVVVQASEQKIRDRVEEICAALLDEYGFDGSYIEKVMASIRESLPDAETEMAKLVPAKTYLFPLLYHHLHRRVSYSGTLDQLKVRLARHCELDVDPGLQGALLQASQARP